METKKTNTMFEIDKTNHGNLTVSDTVVKKLVYNVLLTENFDLILNDIEIINYRNKNVELEIKLQVDQKPDLISLKQQIITLILKQVKPVLNINVTNINLVFRSRSMQ